MWELVELHFPDFVGVACPNIIQTDWCWKCLQFSQVIFLLILESIKIKLLCVYTFLNPSLANVPILYPMKLLVIFKRGTEMEHWLKID